MQVVQVVLQVVLHGCYMGNNEGSDFGAHGLIYFSSRLSFQSGGGVEDVDATTGYGWE